LLTESCKEETKAIVAKGNTSAAFRTAFANLGELAMKELMNNDEVNSAISGFDRYMDKSKFQEAFGSK
jgi:hypothetical protein